MVLLMINSLFVKVDAIELLAAAPAIVITRQLVIIPHCLQAIPSLFH